MHVPFLFLIINFVFITNLQFQKSKTTTCYFIHGYIIMYVYMNIHVHCFMASLDKLLDPPHLCNIIQIFNKRYKSFNNMDFLVLLLKKTLKLSLKNTFARTVPWVNRPLKFGKNKKKTYCSEKSKIKNIFPICP